MVDGMSKKNLLAAAVTFVLIGLMLISQAKAEISKPSVPEFTPEYVNNSYDIAPVYTTDPYTNNTVIQTYGKHADNRTIVITIKNQPFTPFKDSNGKIINLFYNVRYKGTFGQYWTEMYGVDRMVFDNSDPLSKYGYKIQDYDSQNTIVAITSPAQQGQMDVQVEALEGYTNQTGEGHIIFSWVSYAFYGEESGWSNTETITLGETSAHSPTPSSSPSPSFSPSPSPQFATPSPTLAPTLEPTSTPSPSLFPTTSTSLAPTIEPTVKPTSTPKPQTGFLNTNLPIEYGYAIVAVLAIIIVAGISLVRLRKLRK
jgi:hypothetical protein